MCQKAVSLHINNVIGHPAASHFNTRHYTVLTSTCPTVHNVVGHINAVDLVIYRYRYPQHSPSWNYHSRTFLCGLPRENVEVGVETLSSLHALLLPRGLLQLDRAQLLHADRHRRLGR